MARTDDPLQAPGLQITARDTGDRFEAPRTNRALQLAQSLASIEPSVDSLLGTIAADNKKAETAKAQRDAMATAGEKFGDAVRSGKLKKTQNPFYIQAYGVASAAVRSKQQLSALQIDSATWAEKNDPQAFAKRWTEEVGKLGETYQDTDAIAGFTPVAAQFTQQVLQSNVSDNARRIEVEHANNMGASGADALQQALRTTGGTLTPEQTMAALAPIKAQWIATGGAASEFDALAIKMVTTAAYASNNPDLLDNLKAIPNSSGKGSLYDIPGVSDSASTDQYRIGQNMSAAVEARTQRLKAEQVNAGYQAVAELDAKFGDSILTRPPSANEIVSFLGDRYTTAQKAEAIKIVSQRVTPYASLDSTRYDIIGNTAEGKRQAYGLATRAATEGYSAGLEQEIADAVFSGDLSAEDGAKMVAKAVSTSTTNAARGRAEANFTRTQVEEFKKAGGVVHNTASLKDSASALASGAAMAYQRYMGKPLDAKPRASLTRQVQDAAGAHLALHPGDWDGANQAARNYATKWTSENASAKPKGGSGDKPRPGSNRGNPRG